MINKIYDDMLHSNHAISESVRLGILLAIVGGFLDAYTFVGRGGVLANAQTGNLVFLAVYAAKGQWMQALVYVPPILAFVAGVIAVESIKSNSSKLFLLDWPRAVLILEIIVLFIIGFVPSSVPDIFVTVTVAFVSSVQVSSFRKLVDSQYNTTMSTGNLRTASQAAYMAFTKKDHGAAIRAIRFSTIIFTFLLGAFLGGLMTSTIGDKAVWAAVIILIFALILFILEEQKNG